MFAAKKYFEEIYTAVNIQHWGCTLEEKQEDGS
jgi:hypothetical protein